MSTTNPRIDTVEMLQEDYLFAKDLSRLVKYLGSTIEVEHIQAVTRSIIAKYGWNPAMYPKHSRYLFSQETIGENLGALSNAKKFLTQRIKSVLISAVKTAFKNARPKGRFFCAFGELSIHN